MWTKRGVGYGLPYGPPYGLAEVNFFKTQLSIAVNLCKQSAPLICHIYDSLLELLTVPMTTKHMKPFSIKIIMFIIIKALGRCII